MNQSLNKGRQTPESIVAPSETAIQVGVVVRDLEQTMRGLTEVFGIGPFRMVECPPPRREDHQFYCGRSARFRTRQAFADLGTIELELIQPLEGQTIWSDFLAAHGPGLHHLSTEELDGLLLCLASEATSYFTGQTLLVDGGMSTGATRAMRNPQNESTQSDPAGSIGKRPHHTRSGGKICLPTGIYFRPL